MQHKSIVIVGGGPIGLITAKKMALAGYLDITILDPAFTNDSYTLSPDGRVLALSYNSCKLLKELGALDLGLATSIKQVHISHSGLGISKILAEDINIPELGYTIKYYDLCKQLYEQVKLHSQIKLQNAFVSEVIPGRNCATIVYGDNNQPNYLTADLVILAGGGKIKLSQVEYREYDYNQAAVIAVINTQLQHSNIAYERFDDQGALVLLPHESSYVLVWSGANLDKEILKDRDCLTDKLNKLEFMKRFGKIEVEPKIHAFDLKLQVAKNRVLDRVVLVGNSAQIVHPISAQGLNLGLRDISSLMALADRDIAQMLVNLKRYNSLRHKDAKFVVNFTHFLAKFIEKSNTGHLRGLGLIALSNFPALQNKLASSLIFGN